MDICGTKLTVPKYGQKEMRVKDLKIDGFTNYRVFTFADCAKYTFLLKDPHFRFVVSETSLEYVEE